MPHQDPSRRLSRLRAIVVVSALAVVAGACVTVDRGADRAAGTPGTAAAASPAPAASADAVTPSLDPVASPTGSADPSASVLLPSRAIASAPPPSELTSIGYLSLDESLPFVQAVSQGVREAATTAGVAVVECDPGWSRTGVTDCAAELARAGVHGIISFQPFADLSEDVCAAVSDRPIVGVVFDQGSCQVAQLVIDQAESGRLAGDAMGVSAVERWDCEVNSWISLESSDADPDGRARMQGYRDGFTQHCPLPDRAITLDDADRLATAQTQMADLLADLKGKPNLVVGLNEDAILGAIAAVGAADRADQFWYSGQLADPSIRQTIACDTQYVASVAQFPDRFGAPLVTALIDVLEGREAAAIIAADLELVDAENVRILFPDTPDCDE
jgi:ribose transport system substrate-binding protein